MDIDLISGNKFMIKYSIAEIHNSTYRNTVDYNIKSKFLPLKFKPSVLTFRLVIVLCCHVIAYWKKGSRNLQHNFKSRRFGKIVKQLFIWTVNAHKNNENMSDIVHAEKVDSLQNVQKRFCSTSYACCQNT